jgi:hypothetical protein
VRDPPLDHKRRMPSLRNPREMLGTASAPGAGGTASVWWGQRAGNHSTSPGCSTASYGDASAFTSAADKSYTATAEGLA